MLELMYDLLELQENIVLIVATLLLFAWTT